MAEFEAGLANQESQRQVCEAMGIARSTLQDWQKRKQSIEAAPEVVAFFESCAGVRFLHRLVLAAHFAMNQVGSCGIRQVCLFLELSQLNRFVGTSYGLHQGLAQAMEREIVSFGQTEDQRLCRAMRAKQISLCQDETYHGLPCLVGIEPVSNFILLEQYAQSRSAKEWTDAMAQAIGDKPIEIIQSTSDEGTGISRYVKDQLGAHHSPDLMHVQAELVKATSVSLAAKTRNAQTALEKAHQQVERQYQEKAAYHLQLPPRRGRPPAFDTRIQKAKAEHEQRKQALDEALSDQAKAKQAIQDISATYHPYDLKNGKRQDAQTVHALLDQHFSCIEEVAQKASLPARCGQKIQKAKKRTVDMVATLTFFFWMVQAKVEALELAPSIEQAIYDHLIPGIYLSRVAEKSQTAKEKHALNEKSQHLLAPLFVPDSPLSELESEDLKVIEQVAVECADLFQRSSSCVEGRNGQLGLRHHHLHRIRSGKLKALTTVHNYFLTRPDGTTPAERFFGSKPADLFQWLLERVELPGRPARKRPQKKLKTYLTQAFT